MTGEPAAGIRPICVILGGGGHAAVLIDTIRQADLAELAGVLDADQSRHGHTLLDVPVLGDDRMVGDLAGRGVTHFVVGVGGVGDNGPRQRLFQMACDAGLLPLTVRHPSATVSRWSVLGPGCQILPGSVVNARATLGANVIVNSGAIVEHDCRIADHVHLATGSTLASAVTVGTGAHVGAGATVIQCRTIGEWAIVGAGAAVVEDVAAGSVVVGVPARPLVRRGGADRGKRGIGREHPGHPEA